jgi:hypothetical protein
MIQEADINGDGMVDYDGMTKQCRIWNNVDLKMRWGDQFKSIVSGTDRINNWVRSILLGLIAKDVCPHDHNPSYGPVFFLLTYLQLVKLSVSWLISPLITFAVRVIKWLLMHLEIIGGKCVFL